MDLLKRVPKNRLPHAMAIVGAAEGQGLQAAWSAAARLVCEAGFEEACGQCGSCRRSANHQHEGVLVVGPEKGVLKLEVASRIAEFLSLRRVTSARIVIVEDAQTLNVQATNALLKLVEEPPESTYFFLLVPDVAGLLPTLRSRVQILRMPRGPRETPSEIAEQKSVALQFLQGCVERQHAAVPGFLEGLEDRAQAESATQAMQWILRESLVARAASETPDIALEGDQLTALWREAFQAEQDLKAHGDRNLIFENFYYRVGDVLD